MCCCEMHTPNLGNFGGWIVDALWKYSVWNSKLVYNSADLWWLWECIELLQPTKPFSRLNNTNMFLLVISSYLKHLMVGNNLCECSAQFWQGQQTFPLYTWEPCVMYRCSRWLKHQICCWLGIVILWFVCGLTSRNKTNLEYWWGSEELQPFLLQEPSILVLVCISSVKRVEIQKATLKRNFSFFRTHWSMQCLEAAGQWSNIDFPLGARRSSNLPSRGWDWFLNQNSNNPFWSFLKVLGLN